MIKKITLGLACLASLSSVAQVYVSKTSKVHFFSKTPMEDIEATSKAATALLNNKTGDLVISMTIKSFKFSSDLMEEHFNENYMESEKFPKADFKGKITNIAAVDFTKNGTYKVQITGDFTIHGVKKTQNTEGNITINNGAISGNSKFVIKLEDYNIERPKIVWEKIAENIDVDCAFDFQPYKK